MRVGHLRELRMPSRYAVFLLIFVAPLFGWPGRVVGVSLIAWLAISNPDRFWREMKVTSFVAIAYIGVWAYVDYFGARYVANLRGDAMESAGERAVGERSWLTFHADSLHGQPLDVYDALRFTLKPGSHLKVRRAFSTKVPGGYVAELDGEGTIEVRPAAKRLTMIASKKFTRALLTPGRYAVRGNPHRDILVVRIDSGAARVGGNASIESNHSSE